MGLIFYSLMLLIILFGAMSPFIVAFIAYLFIEIAHHVVKYFKYGKPKVLPTIGFGLCENRLKYEQERACENGNNQREYKKDQD